MMYLLTATGARPAAWAICEKLMAAQRYAGPVTWIIVDDGPEAQPVAFQRDGWDLVIIRPEPFWKLGDNTQARNLLAGLDVVPPDARLVIIEDDDYYAPDWLDVVDQALDKAELVGEIRARYYNLPQQRFRELMNTGHSSLCSTAMRGAALARFRTECRRRHTFIDMHLWRAAKSRHLFNGHRVVGMKGLPGRGGIGIGHNRNFRGQHDPGGKVLRQWVGADAELYL